MAAVAQERLRPGPSAIRVEYRQGEERPGCHCARIVRRPRFLPALVAGPMGEKIIFPPLRADGTIVVWHRPRCPEAWR